MKKIIFTILLGLIFPFFSFAATFTNSGDGIFRNNTGFYSAGYHYFYCGSPFENKNMIWSTTSATGTTEADFGYLTNVTSSGAFYRVGGEGETLFKFALHTGDGSWNPGDVSNELNVCGNELEVFDSLPVSTSTPYFVFPQNYATSTNFTGFQIGDQNIPVSQVQRTQIIFGQNYDKVAAATSSLASVNWPEIYQTTKQWRGSLRGEDAWFPIGKTFSPGIYYAKILLSYSTSTTLFCENGVCPAYSFESQSAVITFSVVSGPTIHNLPEIYNGLPRVSTSTTFSVDCSAYNMVSNVNLFGAELPIPWFTSDLFSGSLCYAEKFFLWGVGELVVPPDGVKETFDTAVDNFKGDFPFSIVFGTLDQIKSTAENSSSTNSLALAFAASSTQGIQITVPIFEPDMLENKVGSESKTSVFNAIKAVVWFGAIWTIIGFLF